MFIELTDMDSEDKVLFNVDRILSILPVPDKGFMWLNIGVTDSVRVVYDPALYAKLCVLLKVVKL